MSVDPRLVFILAELPDLNPRGLLMLAPGGPGHVVGATDTHVRVWYLTENGRSDGLENYPKGAVRSSLSDASTRDRAFRWLADRVGIELATAQGPCFSRGGYEAVDGRTYTWWGLWAPHRDGREVHFAASPADYPMALYECPPHHGRPRLAFVPELAGLDADGERLPDGAPMAEVLSLGAILRAAGRGLELLDAAAVAARGGA